MTTLTTPSSTDASAVGDEAVTREEPGPLAGLRTIAELVEHLHVSADRIRLHPSPGTVTESDLVAWNESKQGVPCELVDGTLVRKASMAMFESQVAYVLGLIIGNWLRENPIGKAFDSTAAERMFGGNVRLPDLSVYLNAALWRIYPGGEVQTEPKVSPVVADLAVEVLSESNTRPEIARKRQEYFASGCRLVWIVDPRKMTTEVWVEGTLQKTLGEADTLTGGSVLPGLEIPIAEWFHEARTIRPA